VEINEFRGDHRFLSNFYECGVHVVVPDVGPTFFPTNEHFYQFMKIDSACPEDRQAVLSANTPGQAKRAGQRGTMRPDWEARKFSVMRLGLATKFSSTSPEAEALLRTGDALLREGNTWGDQVWGAVWDGSRWRGQNWLGHLLMARRAELRSAL
jgi:ribA/ribD-fused uncharacterized protein